MTDYLMREASPLEDGLWKEIDEIVVSVMKGRLVGRRVLPLVGPLGWGVDQAPVFDFEVEETSAEARFKEYLELKEIHQEFGMPRCEASSAETHRPRSGFCGHR